MDEAPEGFDVRTTPPRLRIPALIGLMLLIVYFVGCYHYALGRDLPRWAWMGTWKMFTTMDTRHSVVEGEAKINGKWEPFDPEELFPYRWESGPRYARRSFRRSKGRMAVLAASTCVRHPDDIQAVRFWELRWKRTVGSYEQPRRNVEKTLLMDWTCGEHTIELPHGRKL